ncbi:hypothetical protein F2Q68_00016535 [Brassica cretica]|uniref:Uncharacterized protein n=1 Tax=Brassica cretica TaxID=69181 RepID=A0A8S9HBG9_BRACR|nr:hypothetical protein F2Q68_00016535 [Brassica cretica]
MRRKYAINPSVGMRSPAKFERAPDGGAGEVAVYEAYLEAGFRGVFPSLIGEVSTFFGFCPSQLTSLTWRTLMAIQRASITFDPVMAPHWPRTLRGVSGTITPSGIVGTVDVSRPVSFAGEAVAKLIMGVPRRFRCVTFLVSREAFRHSRVWEYRRHLFLSGGINHQAGSFSQAATPRSVVGSRFSEEPSF